MQKDLNLQGYFLSVKVPVVLVHENLNRYPKVVLCYNISICRRYLMKNKKKGNRLWAGDFKLKVVLDIIEK